MALPRIDTPTYQTTLPSTGETINYRPFLVKEQKIIMMAEESQDDNQMIQAVVDLVVLVHSIRLTYLGHQLLTLNIYF